MKKANLFLVLFTILSSSFIVDKKIEPITIVEKSEIKQGKAYWYVTHTLFSDKKMYISKVFNNDCNHCYNEIRDAFKKFLVMNDYETSVNTSNMSTIHDVKESDLEERRTNEIYNRKQKGFQVITVNFSYNK
jgi:hypothetical protein